MTSKDDPLLDQLRRIATTLDDPPEFVEAQARAALSTRRLGDELAQLVADSAGIGETAATRDDEHRVRLLSFVTATVSVELQVEEVAGRQSVRGAVCGTSGEVVVETSGESRRTMIDDRGWFAFDDLPVGLIRVRLRADDGTAVVTSWVS